MRLFAVKCQGLGALLKGTLAMWTYCSITPSINIFSNQPSGHLHVAAVPPHLIKSAASHYRMQIVVSQSARPASTKFQQAIRKKTYNGKITPWQRHVIKPSNI